jgi:predicted MFS family arabinose efflux permease
VFVIYGIAGLARPSDQAIRNVLIAQTVRPETLMGAAGLSRSTADMAKVAGAFAGAGGVAVIGMGPAYLFVIALYVSAFLLSFGLARSPIHAARASAHDVIAGLKEAAHYTWTKPDLRGAFGITFLVNLLAYPFVLGLLPYAAKEVYEVGQSGLGYLAAAFALGALAGSLIIGASTLRLRAGRVMLWSAAAWFVAIALFGLNRSLPLRPRAPLHLGVHAEPLPRSGGSGDAARRRRAHARPRDGHARAGGLGIAVRPAGERADHRGASAIPPAP